MAILHTCFLRALLCSPLPLLIFFSWYNVEAYGGAINCSSPLKGFNHSGKLQLIDKYGPCSPLSTQGKTIPRLQEIFLLDELRVRSIHSLINNQQHPLGDSKATVLPTKSGVALGTGNYIVSIGLGTPKQDFMVAMDTGSDLTWIQCQPCPNSPTCYEQSGPTFDPSKSSSYSGITCGSAECSHVYSATFYSPPCNSACIYEARYGDQSFSIGLFGRETLTLTPSDVFPGFQFGCGQNNSLNGAAVAGLLGLGRTPVSLVSQTASTYGKIFSYCLPRSKSSIGYLAFGDQTSATSSSNVNYTQLIPNPDGYPNFYYVSLIGISVEGQRLAIDPSVFTTPGTIIDSGTVVTRLPPSAYDALRSAFRQVMSESNYPLAPPISPYDTCYDLSGYNIDTVNVPSIVLHFDGDTDLQVDPFSGALAVLSESQACLAFAANRDDSQMVIFGNRQQRTFEVIYDVPGQRLGFAVGTCN
ncbi:PREDICTED: aspartyl protease family protein At5g10770-like [Nelumbo nucifera]|uniref:Aspartyl protease family protein At5g10770-like n=1 Tax=Nelumbo nucifera TaxID=4432 RepID=A0A1U8AUL4_NELNU|nr:PREDICTED: aspartyl protease family protein At5g10770-like [Nelumbo nucifera]